MSPWKKLNILFIEDSSDDIELLLNVLQEKYEQIDYRRVEDEKSLREILDTVKSDLIICDNNMPAFDARSALRIVQEKHAEIPLIIVSGLMSPADAAAAMMAGAADMVSKDDLSRLVPAVNRELQKLSKIGDLEMERAEINRVAYYDHLTGLPNREYFIKKTMALIEENALKSDMAMLVININRFLQIPRSMGSRIANLTLKIIAHRILRCISNECVLARLGGDRFAILVPEVDGIETVKDYIELIGKKLGKVSSIDKQEFCLS